MVKVMWKGQKYNTSVGLAEHIKIQKEYLLSKFMGEEAPKIEWTINELYPNFIELTEERLDGKMNNSQIKTFLTETKKAFEQVKETKIHEMINDIGGLPPTKGKGNRNKVINDSIEGAYQDITVNESSNPSEQAKFSGGLSEKAVSRKDNRKLLDMLEGKYVLSKDEFNDVYNVDNADIKYEMDWKRKSKKKVEDEEDAEDDVSASDAEAGDFSYSFNVTYLLKPDIPLQKNVLRSQGLSNVAYNQILTPSRQSGWSAGTSDNPTRQETEWYKRNQGQTDVINRVMSQFKSQNQQKYEAVEADLKRLLRNLKRHKAYKEAKTDSTKDRLRLAYTQEARMRKKALDQQRKRLEQETRDKYKKFEKKITFSIDEKFQERVINLAKSRTGEKIEGLSTKQEQHKEEKELEKEWEKASKGMFETSDLYDILFKGSDIVNAHLVTQPTISLQLKLSNKSKPSSPRKLEILVKVWVLGELDLLQHRRFLTGKFLQGTKQRGSKKDLDVRYSKEEAPASEIRDLLIKSISAKFEKLERKIQRMEDTVNRTLGERND